MKILIFICFSRRQTYWTALGREVHLLLLAQALQNITQA